MKIAIPVANKQLCIHFGHCEVFEFYDINEQTNEITNSEEITPPPHEPGLLPKWIKEQGANLVLAGGMGQRAQMLLTQSGVKVIAGVKELSPAKVITDYLSGTLQTGANACDH